MKIYTYFKPNDISISIEVEQKQLWFETIGLKLVH